MMVKVVGAQITTITILSTNPNPSLGKKVGQEIFEKILEQSKEVIVQLQRKKPYAFTEKVHD